MRTLCQHTTLHSFLVPLPGLKVIVIVCFKSSTSFAQCLTPCTQHSGLHITHYRWSPNAGHIHKTFRWSTRIQSWRFHRSWNLHNHTYLYARRRTHFSCAPDKAQFKQICTLHMWTHRIGSKRSLCRASLCIHFPSRSPWHGWKSRLSVSLWSCPHLHSLCREPQRPWLRLVAVGKNSTCAYAHWSGMSGCLANPTTNTGYKPNFCNNMSEENTPINIPDSNRSWQCRDDATISPTEDTSVFRLREHQAAASRVPTLIGSLSANLWKSRPESVDSWASIHATGAHVHRESVATTVSSSQQSDGNTDRSHARGFWEGQDLYYLPKKKKRIAVCKRTKITTAPCTRRSGEKEL